LEENMNYKTVTLLFLVALLCVGCGGGESPAAGTWEGTSSLGDLSFEVDASGKNIQTLTYEFTCSSGGVTTTSSGTIEFVMPLEISGGKFEKMPSDISWEGRFSGSDSASGTVIFQDCSGDWKATPQE
jgi:hypothetical protein